MLETNNILAFDFKIFHSNEKKKEDRKMKLTLGDWYCG